jgi:putative tryptophan/tyrosine transport system substrate-binding protein
MRFDAGRQRAWAVVLASIIAVLGPAPTARSGVAPVVVVVKSGTPKPFEIAAQATAAALRASQTRPEILTFDLEGDEANAPAVFARVQRAKPDVIITLGSLATSSALAHSTTEPIVFSMVLYPRESGFLDARGRVTGASLDIPLDVQFAYVRRILPDARRVGVLFHPAETGAVVEAASAAAAKRGLSLVAKPVGEHDDVVDALETVMEEVDVVWSVADGHVFTPRATPALILASLRRGVPMIGLSTAHVRAGALAAIYCDYEDVGTQTAALALRVLQGAAPETVPITTPRRVALALNLRTAERLRVTLPSDVEAEAEETVR